MWPRGAVLQPAAAHINQLLLFITSAFNNMAESDAFVLTYLGEVQIITPCLCFH